MGKAVHANVSSTLSKNLLEPVHVAFTFCLYLFFFSLTEGFATYGASNTGTLYQNKDKHCVLCIDVFTIWSTTFHTIVHLNQLYTCKCYSWNSATEEWTKKKQIHTYRYINSNKQINRNAMTHCCPQF